MDKAQNITEYIAPGAEVWSKDDIKLGTVSRVEGNKVFLPYQGTELAIPEDAFDAGGSDHLTLNRTADALASTGWAT